MSRYGWRPDTPDHRDHRFRMAAPSALPAAVDLRPHMPGVYNQGSLGSCTANAIAAAIEYNLRRERLTEFVPSRLFIYYNERDLEGTVAVDAGAEIRDGIKAVASLGACSETIDWPYDEAKFTAKPPDGCYAVARKSLVTEYAAVERSTLALRQALAGGEPVVFGFTCYEGFESDAMRRSGILDLPAAGEASVGGHAVLMVGYDDVTQRFIVRNSWGKSWGLRGYFTMPYGYAADPGLADDFWVIRTVARA